ncbi:MAG: MATE family efflux transporter [Pseudanabaenaceae cyanobacterium]
MMVPLAGLVDTAFLGHLADINQLAGTILGGILFDYLYRILKFLRSSTNALTASAPDRETEVKVLLRSLFVALTIGFAILILQYPIRSLGFWLLNSNPAIELAGMNYFDGRIWGAPAVLSNFVLIGWFLGREKTGTVLLMSIAGNGVNVILDYYCINSWGSWGAGLATALSQYSAFLIGSIVAIKTSGGAFTSISLATIFAKEAFTATVTLKANILIRFLLLISVYAIFTNISAQLGTEILTQNGLLIQIALFSQFTIQGIGMTTQSLVGNLQKEGKVTQILPLLQVSIVTSTTIAVSVAMLTILFPHQVFRLLTNHTEIEAAILNYDLWLLPLLVITALAFMLEGYFIGLKEGEVLRNSAISSFFLGFLPLALLAMYYQNNHILWSALTLYMVSLSIALAMHFPRTYQQLANISIKELR